MNTIEDLLNALKCAELVWMPRKHEHAMYEVSFGGEHIKMRLNDFPDEVPVTLFAKDKEIDLEEFPKTWHFFPK